MSIEQILERLKLDGLELSKLDEEFKSDKEVVLTAIEQNPYAIQFASQKLRDDEEVIEAALKISDILMFRPNPGGETIINYASDRIRNDEELLLSWLKYDHEIIFLFNHDFLGEEYFMRKAGSINPMVLRFASQQLKYNRAFVLRQAKIKGWFLDFSEFRHFHNDREIMLEACKSSSYFFETLPDEFRNDHDFVLEVLKNCNVGPSVIRFIPDSILINKEIIINGFKLNKELLLFLLRRPELLNDHDLILEIYRRMDPSYSFIKPFSYLLYHTWKKHGVLLEDETLGKTGKIKLIRQIISINPSAEIHFKKFLPE